MPLSSVHPRCGSRDGLRLAVALICGLAAGAAYGQGAPCVDNSTTLCLSSNRFKIQATFQVPGGAVAPTQVVKLTPDTGYLRFTNPANIEAVVKVRNGCPVNSRYWVFAGGLTNVRVVITATDTQTGAVKTYVNPQGAAFEPIQDTSAFATCP